MNNNELRYAKLGVLVNKLQKNGITDEQLYDLTVGFADKQLNDLMPTYELWGDTVYLKAIVLKDVE